MHLMNFCLPQGSALAVNSQSLELLLLPDLYAFSVTESLGVFTSVVWFIRKKTKQIPFFVAFCAVFFRGGGILFSQHCLFWVKINILILWNESKSGSTSHVRIILISLARSFWELFPKLLSIQSELTPCINSQKSSCSLAWRSSDHVLASCKQLHSLSESLQGLPEGLLLRCPCLIHYWQAPFPHS